ncbi:MAG: high-affinity nickel-transport family protein [Candidatus Rokubacteria bacterium]|nr:high-affinity nickel-transport family protein [Candidatus Rokubacteria bacterium]
MRHSTDPDHVIAVTTIVSREQGLGSAALIGLMWGLGHTVTIVLAGGAIVLWNLVIPPRVGLTMDLSVALMLILLGLLNLRGVVSRIGEARPATGSASGGTHGHAHRHGDYVHTHSHGHAPDGHGHGEDATPLGWLDRRIARPGLYRAARPLIVGVLHGLAGSAAVALLVLATIRDPRWATAYLLVFGLGTIAGMMLMTVAIAWPFAYTAGRLPLINRYLGMASGVLSLAFGLFLAYQVGFVSGLFGGDPRWAPE